MKKMAGFFFRWVSSWTWETHRCWEAEAGSNQHLWLSPHLHKFQFALVSPTYPSFFLLQMQNHWHHQDLLPSSNSWDSHVPMINPLWYLSRSSTPLIKSDRYIISREYLIENKVKKPRRTFPFTFNKPLPTLSWLTYYIFCPWTFAIRNNVFGLPWSLSCPFHVELFFLLSSFSFPRFQDIAPCPTIFRHRITLSLQFVVCALEGIELSVSKYLGTWWWFSAK